MLHAAWQAQCLAAVIGHVDFARSASRIAIVRRLFSDRIAHRHGQE